MKKALKHKGFEAWRIGRKNKVIYTGKALCGWYLTQSTKYDKMRPEPPAQGHSEDFLGVVFFVPLFGKEAMISMRNLCGKEVKK